MKRWEDEKAQQWKDRKRERRKKLPCTVAI